MTKEVIEQTPIHTVTKKSEIPEHDIDLAMEKEQIAIYLEIFSCTITSIVNRLSFEGLEGQLIACCGFSASGSPISDDRLKGETVVFRVRGMKSGQTLISRSYVWGRRFDDNKLFRWDAVASFVGCSPDELKNACQRLLNSGTTKMYVRWLHNIVGMEQTFGLFEDELIVSGEPWNHKEVDYNFAWNRILLPKLKCAWRILTPEIKTKLLEKRNKDSVKDFTDLDVA